MDSNDNEFHEEKSKKTYLIVLASAVTLLAGGAGLWFSGFNLFGLGGGDKEKEVGKLENETGKTRREQASEQAFQEITKDSLLYNQDTVITAENAEATLLLNDGSRLEMAPGTMIKLNFDSSVSLGGVSRTLNVQILSGEVSGTPAEHSSPKTKIILSGAGKNVELTQPRQTLQVSKPKPTATPTPVQTPSPSPSPSPTFSPTPTPSPSPPPSARKSPPPPKPIVHTGVIIAPTNGTHLKVEDGKNAPIVPVVFEWRVTPEIGITYFYLNRFADESGKTQKILKKGVKGSSFPVDLKLPGHYQWGIGDATDQHLYAKADFYVDPDYRAIQLLAPTVGGAATTSSAIQDKLLTQFDIQLQWKPYDVPAFPGKEYVVSVFSDANSPEAVFQRSVDGTVYSLNKNKVFSGKVYYEIRRSLSNGFTAHSPREEFIFEFIAPLPVLPEDKATVSTATLTNKDHSLLFTWQKTNFTDNYHFQLAKDADFKTVILNTTGKSNFFFLKSPKPGTYFWRVESMAGQMKSGPSPASQLTVTP